MTYNEYISQFETIENPPKKKGFHRHHIVPKCVQIKNYGSVIDNRQIYVTPAQHLWLHILYDRENGTNYVGQLIRNSRIREQDIHCYEDCLPFNEEWTEQTHRRARGEKHPKYWLNKHHSEESNKKRSESCKGRIVSESTRSALSEALKGKPKTEEQKKKQSASMSGERNPRFGKPAANRGTVCWNDGSINKWSKECPGEGWHKGMIKKRKSA